MTRKSKQIAAEMHDAEAKLNALRREHTEAWTREQAAIQKTMTCGRRNQDGHDPLDYWRDDRGYRTCSYCGSMHPDDVFSAIEGGEEIGTTDKSYKLYVGRNGRKFYFQHFDAEQQQRFIDLVNAKKVMFAGGFGFDVLPYFCERKA